MKHYMYSTSKPYVRWWWFSGPVSREAIKEQIEWISENGFGGVEIAWVYPLPGTSAEEGPQFLDPEWKCLVLHAIRECKLRNIGCDLTFGSLWPFNGSFIEARDASKDFLGLSPQRVNRSWESRYVPSPTFVLDHLSREALKRYSDHLLAGGFRSFAEQIPTAFFCDSWEVETGRLTTDCFLKSFSARFGYALTDHLEKLDDDIAVRFDYRRLLSETVLECFYLPFASMCHESGTVSRIQCHGAPTDIVAAYAASDIPETETLLFDPDFALFASSAAALRNKPLVSSESFTCIYGWVPSPGKPPYLGEEQLKDLRCVADAQFAWGVNQVVWHGKPFSTKADPAKFYATVHVGQDGSLCGKYAAFNAYMEQVSQIMRLGLTYSRLAVYLPLEDQWMADELPEELRKPSSRYYWELQECKIPTPLLPWRPLWVSGNFLSGFTVAKGVITNGCQEFPMLHVDAEWMIIEHLRQVLRLHAQGARIILKRRPKEPGKCQHSEYGGLLDKLGSNGDNLLDTVPPILSSDCPLDFWCRRDGESYYLFISHPGMRGLRYPLAYEYWRRLLPITVYASFNGGGGPLPLKLEFNHAESLIIKIDDTARKATFINPGFAGKDCCRPGGEKRNAGEIYKGEKNVISF